MKKIAILGSTGSIGRQTLEVVAQQPDHFRVVALSAHQNREKLEQQAQQFGVKQLMLSSAPPTPGNSMAEFIRNSGAEILVNAISGAAGLRANFAALQCGMDLAIANKESLVMAGPLLLAEAKARNCSLLPIDSEHSAIFQCLLSGRRSELRKIVLTASGGPFRGRTREQLHSVSKEDALKHPTWTMGAKISIDSATLMNKALEMIEAQVLFDLLPEQIEVVIHPQSVVHSMVEFVDGSNIAHLGQADMKIPIQYALSYPDRIEREPDSFSLSNVGKLEFESPDEKTFPSLSFARFAMREGGSIPIVLNAANEMAVAHFLDGRMPFLKIFDWVKRAIDEHPRQDLDSLTMIENIDRETREKILSWT